MTSPGGGRVARPPFAPYWSHAVNYFVEFYDREENHVGTRAIRATDPKSAQAEAEYLRQATGCTVHLFEQPPMANYRLLSTHP